MRERITDFVSASDKILLDDAFHSNIGAVGNFVAGDARFAAGAATFTGNPAVAATDLAVI